MVFALSGAPRERPWALKRLEAFSNALGAPWERSEQEELGVRSVSSVESGTLGFPDCHFLGLRLAVILFASLNDN